MGSLRTNSLAIICLMLIGLARPPMVAGQAASPSVEQLLEQASDLQTQAQKLQSAGQSQEAIAPSLQSLAIRKKILGKDHLLVALSLNNLGSILNATADFEEARNCYEEALKIYEKDLTKDPAYRAAVLNNLAGLLAAEGDYTGSRRRYEQALNLARQVLGEEHQYTASAYSNLGNVQREQGDYAAAQDNLAKAVTICLKTLGDKHSETAHALNNYSALLEAQGDLVNARTSLEKALQIYRTELGNDHPLTATLVNNLGQLLAEQGDFQAAGVKLEEALQTARRVLGDEHPFTIKAMTNVGALLRRQEDYKGARPYLERALAANQKLFGPDHPDTAHSHISLALVLREPNEIATATDHYKQAIAIQKKALPAGHPDIGNALDNLGSMLLDQGETKAARPYLEEALQIYRKAFGLQHPSTVRMLSGLCMLEAKEDHWDEAIARLDSARRANQDREAKTLGGLTPREQLAYLQQTGKSAFEGALSMGLQRREDPRAVTASAAWLINGKAVANQALGDKALLARQLSDPQSQELTSELLSVRQHLSRLTLSAAESGKEQQRTDQLAQLTQAEEQLSRQLAERTGTSAAVAKWIELADIRDALASNSVLIDIAHFYVLDYQKNAKDARWQPARYVAWVIPATDCGEVQLIDFGPADEIDMLVQRARTAIADATRDDGVLRAEGELKATEVTDAALQAVAKRVWSPLAASLPKTANELIFSPDGELWLLPWAALPLAEGKCLIEDYQLRFVISSRDMVRGDESKPKTQPLVFADPDFDLSPKLTLDSIRAIFPKQPPVDLTRSSVVSQSSLPRAKRLANTKVEAEAIAPSIARYSGRNPQLYLGRYALETVVKKVRQPELLVLATHGYFLPDQEFKPADGTAPEDLRSVVSTTVNGTLAENPLLRCGLLLSGCNNPQTLTGDDGVMTGLEIVGLDLHGTNLVVLSACESAMGKVQTGEGVAGLRQAFQLAGAKSVVATLWQVPDRDSALLMNDFFANLAAGQSRFEALRNAQLNRIASRRERNGAANPFFWAAWTITGQ